MVFTTVDLGQNANDKLPLPKTLIQKMLAQTPKPLNQRHFIYWRFVFGIQTGYPDSVISTEFYFKRSSNLFRGSGSIGPF